jgi:site-specific DNA-methyltransferase (adenine-specific)
LGGLNRERKGTRTSGFGVSKRESHDSSEFYSRKIYENIGDEAQEVVERTVPKDLLNTVSCVDSRDLSLLPDESIHLMVTSPPYNVGKEYDDDLTLKDYMKILGDVCREVYAKLVVGGRACVRRCWMRGT